MTKRKEEKKLWNLNEQLLELIFGKLIISIGGTWTYDKFN